MNTCVQLNRKSEHSVSNTRFDCRGVGVDEICEPLFAAEMVAEKYAYTNDLIPTDFRAELLHEQQTRCENMAVPAFDSYSQVKSLLYDTILSARKQHLRNAFRCTSRTTLIPQKAVKEEVTNSGHGHTD